MIWLRSTVAVELQENWGRGYQCFTQSGLSIFLLYVRFKLHYRYWSCGGCRVDLSSLTSKIPTHWNGAAQIDGWGSKINIFLPGFLPFLGALFHPHIIDQQFQVGSRANSNFRLFALAGMIVLWLAAAFLMWIMYRYAGR